MTLQGIFVNSLDFIPATSASATLQNSPSPPHFIMKPIVFCACEKHQRQVHRDGLPSLCRQAGVKLAKEAGLLSGDTEPLRHRNPGSWIPANQATNSCVKYQLNSVASSHREIMRWQRWHPEEDDWF